MPTGFSFGNIQTVNGHRYGGNFDFADPQYSEYMIVQLVSWSPTPTHLRKLFKLSR